MKWKVSICNMDYCRYCLCLELTRKSDALVGLLVDHEAKFRFDFNVRAVSVFKYKVADEFSNTID
jgi:hypothetical protein